MDDVRRDRWDDELKARLAWEEAPPPDSLRAAVELVITDFSPNEVSVTYGRRRDSGLVVKFDSSTWFLGDVVPSGAELCVAVAHFLQDQEFDGQGSEPWGKAWPECPGHPHPPVPAVIDGEGVWVCPREGRVLAAIGHLTRQE